jgi:hypothetical protein
VGAFSARFHVNTVRLRSKEGRGSLARTGLSFAIELLALALAELTISSTIDEQLRTLPALSGIGENFARDTSGGKGDSERGVPSSDDVVWVPNFLSPATTVLGCSSSTSQTRTTKLTTWTRNNIKEDNR